MEFASVPRILRSVCLALCVSGLLGVSATAQAAEIPNLDRDVLIKARELPVSTLITQLFGQMQVPIVIESEVAGSVNGDFVGGAGEVLDKIRASFPITFYYDGGIAYAYPSQKLQRNFLKLDQDNIQKVVANAEQLQLTDSANRLIKSDAGIVVSGTERFHEQISEIYEAVQSRTGQSTPEPDVFRMFRLKYAWADDIVVNTGDRSVKVPGVATKLRQLIEPGAIRATPDEPRKTSSRRSLDGLRGKGLQAANVEPTPVAVKPNADEYSDDGSTASTRIVADSLNNAVLIRDKAYRMDDYAQLIDSLDIEPDMIEIEATIIDMDTDRLRELGVNWRAQIEDGEATVGNAPLANFLQPGVQTNASGPGGVLSLILGDRNRFLTRIQALESQGAARIVSKPHVMTLSNTEAILNTSSSFFVRIAGQEEVDLFEVPVGTTMRVTPHVFKVGDRTRIKLLANIEDGSTADGLVDDIPIVENSRINTQALVEVGQSLLIGGLVREFKSSSVSKVPLMGDIPFVGNLFRSTNRSSNRIERMFLITPRLNRRPVANGGPRLDVPYLEGTEGEIIIGASKRLESTQQALKARDDLYGVREPLPAGSGANPGLSAADTRAAITISRPLEPVEPEQTLRERLLRSPARFQNAKTPAAKPPSSEYDMVKAPSKLLTPVTKDIDQWQAVPASLPTISVNRSVDNEPDITALEPTAAPYEDVESSRLTTDNTDIAPASDGWQAVQ